MKTLTVYCDKDLVIKWNEWPEEPEYCTDIGDAILLCGNTLCRCDNQLKAYRYNLELAKRESKPFENQRLVKAELICHINDSEKRTAGNLFTMSSFQPDTFYSFPFDGEVNYRKKT